MRLDFSTITSGLPLVEYSTRVFDNTIPIEKRVTTS